MSGSFLFPGQINVIEYVTKNTYFICILGCAHLYLFQILSIDFHIKFCYIFIEVRLKKDLPKKVKQEKSK